MNVSSALENKNGALKRTVLGSVVADTAATALAGVRDMGRKSRRDAAIVSARLNSRRVKHR